MFHVVEKTSRMKSTSVLDQENKSQSKTIDFIIEKYISHLDVIKINKKIKNFNPFSFQKVSNTTAYELLKKTPAR